MSIFNRHSSRSAGLAPGALVHIGERKAERTRITVVDFDATTFEEREVAAAAECSAYAGKPTITWVNVDGLHDVDTIARIGGCFAAHQLILEDIVDTNQRPKLDYEREKYLFVVLKMLEYDDPEDDLLVEQVSLLITPNSVVSFQEVKREGDVFDPVRKRLRNQEGRIRRAGADYLAYSLMDAVVDGYFAVLERLGERVEDLEEELIQNVNRTTLHRLHALKRQLLLIRKAVWPLREVISALQRGDSPLIAPETAIYLRDLHDHIIQVIDTIETLRDMASGMLDIYLSSVSNRLNEVMKVLTIIATIFIPLTFIVGIYGMNFRFMPEIAWPWGYPLVWAIMLAVTITMLAYFRKKRWL